MVMEWLQLNKRHIKPIYEAVSYIPASRCCG